LQLLHISFADAQGWCSGWQSDIQFIARDSGLKCAEDRRRRPFSDLAASRDDGDGQSGAGFPPEVA